MGSFAETYNDPMISEIKNKAIQLLNHKLLSVSNDL